MSTVWTPEEWKAACARVGLTPAELRADDEGEWITINGAHVLIKDGKVEKGPAEFVGKSVSEISGGGKKYNPNSKDVKQAIKTWQNIHQTTNLVEAVHEAAKNGDASNPIIAGIRNEKTNGQEVTRGLKVKEDNKAVLGWKAGQEIQILPASFTTKQAIAEGFAKPLLDTDAKTGKFTGKYTPVVLHVAATAAGGGKTAGMLIADRGQGMFRHEQEAITGGRFKVDDVRESHDIKHIYLTQTGVF